MKAFEEAEEAYRNARMAALDKALRDAILALEEGRWPSNEEIGRCGRRVFFPNGMIVWYWDEKPIVKERDSYDKQGFAAAPG